jgi:hypothetical protein
MTDILDSSIEFERNRLRQPIIREPDLNCTSGDSPLPKAGAD